MMLACGAERLGGSLQVLIARLFGVSQIIFVCHDHGRYVVACRLGCKLNG
jgi:hypothetical protein